MSRCKFLWGNPWSRHSTARAFTSGTSNPRWFSLTLLHERIRRRIWLKLQLSPLEHCPLNSHCQQSPRVLCTRCFVPRILDHGVYFIISVSGFKILISNFLRDIFLPLSSISDNQVLISSDDSPSRTIPVQSRISQTLVFLICTILPRNRQVDSLSLIKKITSHLESNSWISFRRTIVKRSASFSTESLAPMTRKYS